VARPASLQAAGVEKLQAPNLQAPACSSALNPHGAPCLAMHGGARDRLRDRAASGHGCVTALAASAPSPAQRSDTCHTCVAHAFIGNAQSCHTARCQGAPHAHMKSPSDIYHDLAAAAARGPCRASSAKTRWQRACPAVHCFTMPSISSGARGSSQDHLLYASGPM
jgi:hypothetical protein